MLKMAQRGEWVTELSADELDLKGKFLIAGTPWPIYNSTPTTMDANYFFFLFSIFSKFCTEIADLTSL